MTTGTQNLLFGLLFELDPAVDGQLEEAYRS
jgi:hypothetical protein